MKRFWNNGIMQLFLQLADLVLLNIAWIIASLPIITIGASSAAKFSVAQSIADGGGISVFFTFFTKLRNNLRSCLLPSIMTIICFIILIANFLYVGTLQSFMRPILFGLLLFLTFFIFMLLSCLFPLLDSYKMDWKTGFKASFIMCLANPLQAGILATLHLIPIVLFLFMPQLFLFLIPVWVTIYSSGTSYLAAKLLMNKIRELAENSGYMEI